MKIELARQAQACLVSAQEHRGLGGNMKQVLEGFGIYTQGWIQVISNVTISNTNTT